MKSVRDWVLVSLAIILLIMMWNRRITSVAARALESKRLHSLMR